MDRRMPSSISDEIKLYRSTIYSLLRSSAEVKIKAIEEIHAGMNSLMHPGARNLFPDVPAFVYSYLRLPDCISEVTTLVLGQNSEVFKKYGYSDIDTWQPVSAVARRRRCKFDKSNTLACYIASRSDIEDVVPTLTALQIEWNKLHNLLNAPQVCSLDSIDLVLLSRILMIEQEELEQLKTIWGKNFLKTLQKIREKKLSFGIRLLNSSLSYYIRATHEWFENIVSQLPVIKKRPVYFVSSNTHSFVNILSGFALRYENELIDYLNEPQNKELLLEWKAISSNEVNGSRENFFYYVFKKYQATSKGECSLRQQLDWDSKHGISRIASETTFEVEAQIIELCNLDPELIDPRLRSEGDILKKSDAIILNVDYPLGLGAYNILSTISIHTDVFGVYSMGKAASLNAVRGDVLIPDIVQDEHSHNTYMIQNCFSADDVSKFLNFGTVLDNQKAITVLGTFLQNAKIMDVFYNEGFADIEMEAGNFCSAIYEATRPKRYPLDEIVSLYNIPIDVGILHYVSDTPMSKGKNLGAGTLSYYGMDSTYATSLAILQRILRLEKLRLDKINAN